MKATELIGRTITDIWVWSKIDWGGLDEANVFLELDNQIAIGFPVGLEIGDLSMKVRKGAVSLFKDESDIPVYAVNPERKTIWGKLKSLLGLDSGLPKEYRECKIKSLKNQKIKDLLLFEEEWEVFIELENGFFITETRVSPNGLGQGGLNYYENLEALEERQGKDYNRMIGGKEKECLK